VAFLKKEKVADFFLTEANPYSKKRSIKMWHLGAVFIGLVVIVLGVGSYLDSRALHEREVEQFKREAEKSSKQPAQSAQATSSNDQSYVNMFGGQDARGAGQSGKSRQYSASQIIKRGDNASDVLPIGTVVKVRLQGNVESTDSNSPVSAILIENAMSPAGFVVIPQGTKVIGQGQLDLSRERLQVRFHTIVFPEGDQFSVAALATMPDGSSGMAGDFSSGALKKHASQFVGDFIGGMAEGLKDRTTGGQMGIPFEPGSLKNGALNGIAQSSLNYAKSESDDMGKSQASIKVKANQEFILYFEREFHQ
jgi:hypothetical protein